MKKKIKLSNGNEIKIEYSSEVAGVLRSIFKLKTVRGNRPITIVYSDIDPQLNESELQRIITYLGNLGIGIVTESDIGLTVFARDTKGNPVKTTSVSVDIKDEDLFTEFVNNYLGMNQDNYQLTLYSKSHKLVYESNIDPVKHEMIFNSQTNNAYLLLEYMINHFDEIIVANKADEIFNKVKADEFSDSKKRFQNTINLIREKLNTKEEDDIFIGKVSVGLKLKYLAHTITK